MPIIEPVPLEKTLMRDDVYQNLKSWIVQGTLEPEEKLRDIDLANQLGVSRTPVREADRKSTRLNSSHLRLSRMPSSA